MEYEETIEKSGMIEDSPVVTRPSTEQIKIQKTRKILLILLSISFTFDLIYLVFIIHAYVDNSWFGHYFKSNYELIWTILSVIYDAFGLFVTCRYFRRGLRVYAGIGVVLLVIMGLLVAIVCTAAALFTGNPTKDDSNDNDMMGPIFSIITLIISTIMLVITILFAFKLSNLIASIRRTTIWTM